MKFASFGPWSPSSATTRKNPAVASLGLPPTGLVSDVRVADSETCTIPAAKYAALDAATPPEVEGPRIAITLGSAMNFCASACAGAPPCSTGVSPVTSEMLKPYFRGSVLTAYFAQLSCSLPRNPAPPVSGVGMASFNLPWQLTACDLAAAT